MEVIDRRSTGGRQKANAQAQMWAESERRYYQRQREERRQEWADYHAALADSIEATAAELVARHRAEAQRLKEGGPCQA